MTHKWDYEPNPWNSTWENMPFWLRWPLMTVFVIVVILVLVTPILPLVQKCLHQ